MRRGLASLVFEKLPYFQTFDAIAVYYDSGRGTVRAASLPLCSMRWSLSDFQFEKALRKALDRKEGFLLG